jgi:glycosyltransferase involved in cell wall biosynthesis
MVRFLRRANNLLFRLLDPGKAAYQVADIMIRAIGALRLNRALARFAPDVMVFPDHGSPALFIKRVEDCRRIMIAHHNASRFIDLPLTDSLSQRDIQFALALENRTLRGIDKVICPSAHMREVFSTTHRYVGPVEVVRNMVDPSFLAGIKRHDPRPNMGLAPDAPLIYVPGGGNKFKGSTFVSDIIGRLSERAAIPLGFYVSGAVDPELKDELASVSDAARLFIPGAENAMATLSVVKACSFGIYPTLAENYSMAILEALLCGVPMVTFEVGGNAEIIKDGINGYLISPYDVDALVTAAAHLLDSETVERISSSTVRDAEKRLGSTAVADDYVRHLTTVDSN